MNTYLPLREIFRILARPNDSYLKLSSFSSQSNHRIPSTNFEESEKYQIHRADYSGTKPLNEKKERYSILPMP